MAKTLLMNFMTAAGKKTSVKLANVKDAVTKDEVSAVMDTILAKNIFDTSGGDLKSKHSAQVVERTSSELEVK